MLAKTLKNWRVKSLTAKFNAFKLYYIKTILNLIGF